MGPAQLTDGDSEFVHLLRERSDVQSGADERSVEELRGERGVAVLVETKLQMDRFANRRKVHANLHGSADFFVRDFD